VDTFEVSRPKVHPIRVAEHWESTQSNQAVNRGLQGQVRLTRCIIGSDTKADKVVAANLRVNGVELNARDDQYAAARRRIASGTL
jgi:hypothetical protein